MGRQPVDLPVRERDVLPHPAEDLSEDDDLLSWILVDQLGCLPNTKLGVHPQQVKFVGPSFRTDDVLTIIRETITKGNMHAAVERLLEFHLIKDHLASKQTEGQRKRVKDHIKRYLNIYEPTTRVEIHTTARYSHVTGHPELAVFAIKPLEPGDILRELKGGVVPLPDSWREEMDIGDAFKEVGEKKEDDTEIDEEMEEQAGTSRTRQTQSTSSIVDRRDKGKEKESDIRGARRSSRTKRRDFSIIWSGLKRCYQLFLGPARFLNHDCDPNVELHREGKYVTFRVIRPIRVGDELTTFYGGNYFGRDNVECLCLTCEQNQRGGFSVKPSVARSSSRSNSISRSGSPFLRSEGRLPTSSTLRNVLNPADPRNFGQHNEVDSPAPSPQDDVETNESVSLVPDDDELSRSMATLSTPTKSRISLVDVPSPASSAGRSAEAECSDGVVRRERHFRQVRGKTKPIQWFNRSRKKGQALVEEQAPTPTQTEVTEGYYLTDGYPEEFPRCATCVKPLTDQVWYLGRYFEHCARCIRHSLIFELPWPVRDPKEIKDFPPAHLIPPNYIPRRITTVPLPTLSKLPKPVKTASNSDSDQAEMMAIVAATAPMDAGAPDTKEERLRRRETNVYEFEQFVHETLREEAWRIQEAQELAEEKRKAAREEARKQREEEKRKRNEGKLRGSGLWQRYAIITQEEYDRQQAEKNKVRSGTRRGGRFRAEADEEEMRKLAEEVKERERKEKEEREAKSTKSTKSTKSIISARSAVVRDIKAEVVNGKQNVEVDGEEGDENEVLNVVHSFEDLVEIPSVPSGDLASTLTSTSKSKPTSTSTSAGGSASTFTLIKPQSRLPSSIRLPPGVMGIKEENSVIDLTMSDDDEDESPEERAAADYRMKSFNMPPTPDSVKSYMIQTSSSEHHIRTRTDPHRDGSIPSTGNRSVYDVAAQLSPNGSSLSPTKGSVDRTVEILLHRSSKRHSSSSRKICGALDDPVVGNADNTPSDSDDDDDDGSPFSLSDVLNAARVKESQSPMNRFSEQQITRPSPQLQQSQQQQQYESLLTDSLLDDDSNESTKRGRGRPPGTGHLQKQAASRYNIGESSSSLGGLIKRGRGRPPSRSASTTVSPSSASEAAGGDGKGSLNASPSTASTVAVPAAPSPSIIPMRSQNNDVHRRWSSDNVSCQTSATVAGKATTSSSTVATVSPSNNGVTNTAVTPSIQSGIQSRGISDQWSSNHTSRPVIAKSTTTTAMSTSMSPSNSANLTSASVRLNMESHRSTARINGLSQTQTQTQTQTQIQTQTQTAQTIGDNQDHFSSGDYTSREGIKGRDHPENMTKATLVTRAETAGPISSTSASVSLARLSPSTTKASVAAPTTLLSSPNSKPIYRTLAPRTSLSREGAPTTTSRFSINSQQQHKLSPHLPPSLASPRISASPRLSASASPRSSSASGSSSHHHPSSSMKVSSRLPLGDEKSITSPTLIMKTSQILKSNSARRDTIANSISTSTSSPGWHLNGFSNRFGNIFTYTTTSTSTLNSPSSSTVSSALRQGGIMGHGNGSGTAHTSRSVTGRDDDVARSGSLRCEPIFENSSNHDSSSRKRTISAIFASESHQGSDHSTPNLSTSTSSPESTNNHKRTKYISLLSNSTTSTSTLTSTSSSRYDLIRPALGLGKTLPAMSDVFTRHTYTQPNPSSNSQPSLSLSGNERPIDALQRLFNSSGGQ